jgi:DMSO/TMAO reductase YedYZ molybdopterin-dependent catalytic subunit
MPVWRHGKATRTDRSEDRLPPGQRLVKGWPVLHEGSVPTFDPLTWRLRVWGEVEAPLALSWGELAGLPRFATTQDFHCVTTWSRYDNRWSGVAVTELLALARPTPAARFVLLHSYDGIGYTTNVALDDFARTANLVATHHDDEPLAPEHGGPIRALIHHLYAWKSAKWLGGIELLAEDQRGFWETRGYHNRADPWLEQRYSYQE